MRWLLAAVAVLVVLPFPGFAFAQDNGTIEGQVVNQSEGGGSVADLSVSLIPVGEEEGTAETRTTRTDGEGRFQFSNIPVESSYLVRVNYMKIAYYYPLDFNDTEATISIEIPVCDTTANDQAIRISWRHIVVRIQAEYITVAEVVLLVNDGDRTYVGSEATSFEGKQGTLVFTLPPGAMQFEVPEDSAEDYLLVDNMVVTTMVFPPGEKQLLYYYQLAASESGDSTINLKADYPTDALDVMVTGEDTEVSSARLVPAEPVETDDGQHYVHFTGEYLDRGDAIDIRLASSSGGSGTLAIVLWIVGAVVVLCLAAYLVRKSRAQTTTPAATIRAYDREAVSPEQRLLDEIVRLDRDFEQGLLDEETYRQRYADKDARLAELKKHEGTANGNE
ncbi:MAG: carboxypeptidase regulatory-like domain-containing protein [Dehalococcoidales bacterium]|nr:carboxypeptidase regulatory-like domain-containing protein [Dehalococcoidales bacterium]